LGVWQWDCASVYLHRWRPHALRATGLLLMRAYSRVCVSQTGSLVTCANVGDSLGLIDTGTQILPLTDDHRINDNELEQKRVKLQGGLVTNVDRSGAMPPVRALVSLVCLSVNGCP
jgi:Protein phosphatase 2C